LWKVNGNLGVNMIEIIVLSSILGLFVGSFLNVVADRLAQGRDFVRGRSVCDFCGAALKIGNLVPLVSFVTQKGRCSFCQTKISVYYPLSEALTGLLFGLAAHFSNFARFPGVLTGLNFIYLVAVFSVFVIILLSDLKYQVIPNQVVYFGIVFVFLTQVGSLGFWAYKYHNVLQSDVLGQYLIKTGFWWNQVSSELLAFGKNMATGLIICLVFYLLIVITRERGMGGGDMKLGLLIGLYNGFPNGFLGIFLAFTTGALVSLALMIFAKKGFGDTVPFGPFLVVGSIAAGFFGRQLLALYFGYNT